MNDIIQFILKPSQKQTTALLYQNKLDLLGYIIKENENIIDVKDFMPLVLKCLESLNSDVRSSAIKLYEACFNIYGKKVQKYIKNLPKTIKKELLIASGVKT
ncbi:hypothetical protein M9Y10_011364 [Tritrichomonas musculus]|uniref:Uncharacterized protein n=1 Tax=Tritrichomonas musculus TaxID=1915356 RepID=A0ABR2IKT1_9EUKA